MSSYLKQAREWAYPTLKQSAFLTRGVLTPEEFVQAGDELVFKCPTWQWEGGDPQRRKPYLPPDKQYLVTRNVPCRTRVSALEQSVSLTTMVGGNDDDEEGWLVSNMITDKVDPNLEEEFDILDQEGQVVVPTKKPEKEEEEEEEEDEYADMADFEEDVLQDDQAVAAPKKGHDDDDEDSNLVKGVRSYDLSITYDKYYQTPRVWIFGYDGHTQQPLTGNQMLEDVMTDYANRTVTIETHPHVKGPHASIHPCQHGKVMKTIVRNLTKAGEEGGEGEGPSVVMYMFIFLKFVSSIIPTINYDFTMDVTADTSK